MVGSISEACQEILDKLFVYVLSEGIMKPLQGLCTCICTCTVRYFIAAST